jgi:hypothetical protein
MQLPDLVVDDVMITFIHPNDMILDHPLSLFYDFAILKHHTMSAGFV